MRIDINWWNISLFCIIPILSVGIMFFLKRKLLWTAPLISILSSIVMSTIAMPSILSYREHRAMFFGIAIPIHFIIVIFLTASAYFVAYILKQRQK